MEAALISSNKYKQRPKAAWIDLPVKWNITQQEGGFKRALKYETHWKYIDFYEFCKAAV